MRQISAEEQAEWDNQRRHSFLLFMIDSLEGRRRQAAESGGSLFFVYNSPARPAIDNRVELEDEWVGWHTQRERTCGCDGVNHVDLVHNRVRYLRDGLNGSLDGGRYEEYGPCDGTCGDRLGWPYDFIYVPKKKEGV